MSIPANELARIIRTAAIFAHRKGDLPTINQVHFEATGTHLVATGTDRFVLGSSKAVFESEPFEFDLGLESALTLAQVAKPRRGRWGGTRLAELALTPKGVKLNVTFNTDESIGLPTSRAEFPRYKQLFDNARKGKVEEGFSLIAVASDKIGQFAKIPGQMRMQFKRANAPILITIGEDFEGILMPVRMP